VLGTPSHVTKEFRHVTRPKQPKRRPTVPWQIVDADLFRWFPLTLIEFWHGTSAIGDIMKLSSHPKGGLLKMESVCVLCASVLLQAAPWVRDGLELDMDWASNLAWTPLLNSLVCSPSLFGMFRLGPVSQRWITSPRRCHGTRKLKTLTMWYWCETRSNWNPSSAHGTQTHSRWRSYGLTNRELSGHRHTELMLCFDGLVPQDGSWGCCIHVPSIVEAIESVFPMMASSSSSMLLECNNIRYQQILNYVIVQT